MVETPNSSNIRGVDYNLADESMLVYFTNGSLYEYFDVPSKTVCQVLFSDSAGKAFAKFVRGKYEYTKI